MLAALPWLAAATVAAAEPPPPGWVRLALADYLALVERAEQEERNAAIPVEPPVAQLLSQHLSLTVDGGVAEVEGRFEVEVSGSPLGPVVLPLPGLAGSAAVEPRDGAALDRGERGVTLVASRPGRYAVTTRGSLRAAREPGVERFALPPALAAVAVVDVDLPADLGWSAPGTVVAADRVEGSRRQLSLALSRGQKPALTLRRRATGAEEERVLARAVVVTLVELLPAGVRAHDVVLYEVLRGELARLEVELPPGRAVDLAASDEGEVVPAVAGSRLVVERARRLAGVGHLVLTRREPLPAAGGAVALDPVSPRQEVHARYLVLASSVAAEARPLPEEAWQRVDLDDLPGPLRGQVDALEPAAVWRLAAAPPGGLALRVAPLPPAPRLPGLIASRATTTVLSLDGTLLHRDRFVLDAGAGAFALLLPPRATLWTSAVDGAPVRPVERNGRTLLPLPFRQEGETVVEVVTVEERPAEARRRSSLALALPQVEGQVLEHSWRVLLPQGRRYRFAAGTLVPAPLPVFAGGRAADLGGELETVTEMITVTSESALTDMAAVGGAEEGVAPRARDLRESRQRAPGLELAYAAEADALRQGLVGGVKPLPLAIPESGKLLFLAGALPPPQVSLELEVKGGR